MIVFQINFSVFPNNCCWASVANKWHHNQDLFTEEQGWRCGKSTRLPPICPGFDSRTRHRMWIKFVDSLLCSERFFPRVLQFSPLTINQRLNLFCCDLIWFVHDPTAIQLWTLSCENKGYYYYYYLRRTYYIEGGTVRILEFSLFTKMHCIYQCALHHFLPKSFAQRTTREFHSRAVLSAVWESL